MAGGQHRRNGQKPLGVVMREREAARQAAQFATERPAGRHCWVRGPGEDPGPWPGLVVAWARSEEGWRGRVVYVVSGDGDAVVVETWMSAASLRPTL